eukprot:171945-Karenia_brevis.AAC.1
MQRPAADNLVQQFTMKHEILCLQLANGVRTDSEQFNAAAKNLLTEMSACVEAVDTIQQHTYVTLLREMRNSKLPVAMRIELVGKVEGKVTTS